MSVVKKMVAFLLPVMVPCLVWLSPEAAAQNRQVEWTFLVYMDGDNNLESAAIDDFLEMAPWGSDANVIIAVLFDRAPGYDGRYDDWTDTRRGVINIGDVPDAAWGVSLGELNMGDPQTLIDFVEWGMQLWPAANYAVVLWDHGSGWQKILAGDSLVFKSVCVDDTDNDRLFMREVRNALTTIETDEQEPDLVGFDACLMAMVEVAYEIRQNTSVMVGSEKTVPNDGWPYNTILQDLVGYPTMSAAHLGIAIVDRYYESYGNSQILSAVNLPAMGTLAAGIDVFAQTLRDNWNSDAGACVEAACGVMTALDAAVISEEHGDEWPGSHGLAIYFPEVVGDFNAGYNSATILLPADTRWDEFLQDFYSFMAGSWIADARGECQEYDVNGDDPGGLWHIDLYDFCLKLIDNASGILWVDFSYSGTELGTYDMPYNTLAEAVTAAGANATICIKAGSSAEILTVIKGVVLRACGGAAIVGQ